MADNIPNKNPSESEIEDLKKTTRISLDDALSVKPAAKKPTSAIPIQLADKQSTGVITGIPTHTAPIPQTIRLKRPATSPIVIKPDITTAPTIAKVLHPKPSSATAATVIKNPVPPRPTAETSRIILDIEPEPTQIKQKTAPIAAISATEPTPGPKTIRLKRPSTIMGTSQPDEISTVADGLQAAKKSETAKIELPQGLSSDIPATQRKTIRIKRTDRNTIAPRTVVVPRQAAAKPPAVSAAAATPVEEPAAAAAVIEPEADKLTPVFSILAGAAAVCLALLVYLLSTQSFGPELALPVPAGLF